MKQSTTFAQVATNLLNVWQGYTKGIRFVAVLTMLLIVGIGQAWGAVTGDTFTRISTAAELNDGDEIIFVNQTETYSCATMQNNNNRSQTSITTNNHAYTYDSKSAVQIFVVKKNGNNYGFHTGNGYIYSASGSNNYLRTNTTAASTAPSGNYAWTLSVSNYVFTVKNVTNTSYYMAFNGTTIFSQYKTGQSKPYIYKKNAAPTCIPLEMSTVTATPGDSKITLTWSAVNNASNYTVTCSGGTVGSVTGASTKTCTITGLTNGTSYKWSVMPVGDGTNYSKENTPATGSTTPNATYSITYHDKDGAHSVDALGGSALLEVLPNNPTSCDIDLYPHFVGWSTTDIPSGGTTEQPTLVSAEIVNSTTASKTYYAVWSDVDPNAGGGSWEKATSISVGDKVVFVYEEKNQELTGVASNIGTATERTNGIPNGIEGTYVLTVEAGTANNSYSFKNGNIYLSWSNSGNNLYTSNTKNNASSWTINTSTGGNFKFANVGTTSRILQFNSSNPRWACYTSSQSAFQIYKQSTAAGTATYITTCTIETSYSVTYDYNYDKTNDLPVDNNEYTAGSIVTLLPKDAAAHKENCYFAGWATNKEGTGELYQAGDTYIINKSTTFYAKWVECTHDNQLNVEILGDETHEITISWDEVEGANSYMVFLFGESKLGDEKDYTFITSNLSEVINTDNVEVGEYMFEVTPYKDRAIVGCGNGGVITLTDIPTYRVSIATNIQNGTVTSDNLIAKEGDIITLTANPANGYQFESWSVTKEGGGQVNVTDNKFTMPASNVTVSAIFSLIPTLATPDNLRVSNLSCSGVTLAWDKVDGASNYQLIRTNKSTNSPITTQVAQKDNPNVYCTLSAGTSWSWTVQAIGDGLTYNSSEVATGEDFTLHYTITYNENGGSTVGDDCGTTLPAELPTTTKSHYTFAGWYMDEGFNIPAEAGSEINTNITLYAKWEEIKFTITWSINETTNSQELQEGTTINPPADLDAATYACEDKVFVGWVGASIDGSINEKPDFITVFGNVKENKTYYAVFATPNGDGFTLGQSGDFTIYANVGSEILYASNLDNGKLGSTAQINDAVTFIFTHKGNNQYTISNGSKYLALKAYNSTDLQTQNDEYLWTIASATDGKGSWRVTSVNTPSRAIIYRSGYDFKAYGTNNINTNGYYDIEIGGATTYTEYVTSCVTCENVLTIIKGKEENGTFTLDKVGEQETCEGLSIIVTLDPAEHYHVASVSASTGEIGVDNGDGTYTITYAANSTGESTINVVFEEDTKYTVTWMVNGLPYTIGAPSTTVYADERVAALPTPPEPNAYCGDVFVGWTTVNPVSGNFNEAPTVYNEQATFPTATGDQTFYAVFADYDEQQ